MLSKLKLVIYLTTQLTGNHMYMNQIQRYIMWTTRCRPRAIRCLATRIIDVYASVPTMMRAEDFMLQTQSSLIDVTLTKGLQRIDVLRMLFALMCSSLSLKIYWISRARECWRHRDKVTSFLQRPRHAHARGLRAAFPAQHDAVARRDRRAHDAQNERA